MKRVFHKARNFHDADQWDVRQYIKMTPEERMAIALELKRKAYGRHPVDVRESHRRR